MKFLLFNVILFFISYVIDYIAIHLFGLVEWSENYIYYLVVINLPVSTFLTYLAMKKIKEFIGL